MSAVQKTTCSKVTSRNLTSLPISPSYAPFNFSQKHRSTSAHMEELDHFLGSWDQLSPCLNLVSPLATRRFTDNTSCSLPEQSRSYDILVTCYIRSTKRKLADNTHPYQTRAKRDDVSWYSPRTKKPMNKHQNIAKESSLNLSHLTSWSTPGCLRLKTKREKEVLRP